VNPLECLDEVTANNDVGCVTKSEPQDVDRMLRQHVKRGASDHMRSVDLRVLMARLPQEDVGSVGDMLSISPKRLRAFLHGEAYLKKTQAGRVGLLLEIVRVVSQVIEPSAISRWLDAEIPQFNRAPRQMLSGGKGEALRAHIERYQQTAYS